MARHSEIYPTEDEVTHLYLKVEMEEEGWYLFAKLTALENTGTMCLLCTERDCLI